MRQLAGSQFIRTVVVCFLLTISTRFVNKVQYFLVRLIHDQILRMAFMITHEQKNLRTRANRILADCGYCVQADKFRDSVNGYLNKAFHAKKWIWLKIVAKYS